MKDLAPLLVLALQIFPLIAALWWLCAFIYEIIRAPKAEPGGGDEANPRHEREGAGAHGSGEAQQRFDYARPAAHSPSAGDLYRILHVEPGADQAAIHAAFRGQALQFHPDRNLSPDAGRHMQEINEAFRVLRDPAQRAEYDKQASATG